MLRKTTFIFSFRPKWVGTILSEEKNISIEDAVESIYLSDTYRKLEKEDTKYWHLGPVALYEELETEML